ncbi:hypothetical protein [Luteolibacter sp. Populi]|uniref:hypothetical protein n=1 Tax=Luteolibacter sp. Populi TaxID=3230487 RepID=UPI00346627FC
MLLPYLSVAVLALGLLAPAASAGDAALRISTHGASAQNLQVDGTAFDSVPEAKTPFQVAALAGALLIWRNRRRSAGA